ncbi:serine hydrolase [Zeaxanthinibacter sp. PT1]|uniref:serine hydrolase n=1 Tax=Zeaxanthinibacter TaxID=561554 RepID=UPI00234B631A|nr:serine hydrolase [Zeaxanthinibacter sp. PT1]MDC6350771.1 serine hydrolase [Zeaxanthinibacter sp. PT1]
MQNETTARNLVYQRKLKGFTQQELSERTEVTVRTIQRIEKGEVQPHLQTIKLLAAALEIEVNDLIPLENPKEEAIQKKWLLLLHATPLIGFLIPFCNVLIPLFLWIHKREDNQLYNRHGIRVINFHITILLLYALSFAALLTIEKWGFIFFVSVVPLAIMIVLTNIIYAVKEHKCYYPLSIPFLGSGRQRAVKTGAMILCLMASISAVSQESQVITRLDGTVIKSDSLTAKIEQLMQAGKVPGLAVTVYNHNDPVYSETLGYKDLSEQLPLEASTNIYGASLSKAVFSVLVMKLVEEGKIYLDRPLQSYLPKKIYEYQPLTRWHDNFQDLKEDSLYQKITARMCLAHTTGFPNWRWDEADHKLKVLREPGEVYGYSGEGFVYLQVVLEKLTGKGLQELAEEKIFTPLGMKNTAYQWKPAYEENFAYGHNKQGERYKKDTDNEPRSGSTLETTAADYSRFLQAVLHEELLSGESYNELFTQQHRLRSKKQFGHGSKESTNKYNSLNLGYALGWGYLETPYGKGVFKEGHGNGFQHYSIIFPEAGKGVMIMANSDNAESIFKAILEVSMRDTYTPWEWQNYIPYDQQ